MTTIGDDTMLDDDQDETAEVPAADLTQDDETPVVDADDRRPPRRCRRVR